MTFHAAPQRFPLADDTLAWPLGEWEATVTVRNAIIIENFGKWHLQASATARQRVSSIVRSLLASQKLHMMLKKQGLKHAPQPEHLH